MRRLLRLLQRRDVFVAVSAAAVIGGVLVLAAVGAPVTVVVVYIAAMGVLLTYLSGRTWG
jgi:hypothetical protein